ncbi:MAG: SagB/ThcOx family dehydrogenase [Rhodocyclaceae bacterium]|nr:SagB/ThcOx family dehydrogenase [Rhodocyclaceae bacterium]
MTKPVISDKPIWDPSALSVVDMFEADDNSELELAHQLSKLDRYSGKDMYQRVGLVLNHPAMQRLTIGAYKSYSGHPRIDLPPPKASGLSFEDVVHRRRSASTTGQGFAKGPVSLDELSAVLANSYGETKSLPIPDLPHLSRSFRASCSAGALYPLEIYIWAFEVDGLEQSLYHYVPKGHILEKIEPDIDIEAVVGATSYKDLLANAAVLICVSAVFERNYMKYRQRGYRFVLKDAGALLQSLYLAGTAVGLATCAIGGFFDDEVGDLIGIDNLYEAPIIMFALGRQPSDPRATR